LTVAASSSALVTGASGFVGSALVRALCAAGISVTTLDISPSSQSGVVSVVGDVGVRADVETALAGQPTVVFHLAARTSVLGSLRDPEGVYAVNVAATQQLLEGARQAGARHVVLASTNAVVGDVGRDLIDEQTPLRPLTPYGATKAAAEMLASAYTASFELAVAAVRLTNVYGPGMAKKDTFVVRLLRAAASGRSVSVYGDGHQERDYLFIDDAVTAFLLAWERDLTGPITIGAGRSASVLELVELAEAVTGRRIPVEHVPAPAGEMLAVRVDIARARAAGYEPLVQLPEGLTRTWEDLQRSPAATVHER
jgi:UDP-glucose 4-epimerase